MGSAHCGTVFPVSVVVGAAVPAVPAAVCRWGPVPALSWCGEVALGDIHIIIDDIRPSTGTRAHNTLLTTRKPVRPIPVVRMRERRTSS